MTRFALALLLGVALAPWARSVWPSEPIRVLWYTYALDPSPYREGIGKLAAAAHTHAASGGQRWALSFFDPDSKAPEFSRYHVLVIQSGEAYLTGHPPDFKGNKADFRGILGNKRAIEAARGDRTFITGSDADIHAIRGDTGNAPVQDGVRLRCNPPMVGPRCWDGALGHLINAVNWAGRGKGMGIVSLVAAEFPGSDWWLHRDSFLRNELAGAGVKGGSHVTVFGGGTREDNPHIPLGAHDYPLNRGLTSRGLSYWYNSFHAGFAHGIPGYVPVINATRYPNMAVAIASAATVRESAATWEDWGRKKAK